MQFYVFFGKSKMPIEDFCSAEEAIEYVVQSCMKNGHLEYLRNFKIYESFNDCGGLWLFCDFSCLSYASEA